MQDETLNFQCEAEAASSAGQNSVTIAERASPLPLFIWIALNGLDALLTWRGILLGAFEANPGLSALAAHTNMFTMLLVKFLIAGLLGIGLWQRGKTHMLLALDILMLAIVVFNTCVIAYIL